MLRRTSDPRPHLPRVGLLALATVFLLGVLTTTAFGSFNARPNASMSISTATLVAPTGLSATGGCQALIVGPKMTLNWTATTSSFAAGYTVWRSTTHGSGYSQIATVSGRTTVTYTDTTVSGLSTTYFYVLQATFASWSSANSSEASGTTPSLCV